MSDLYRVVAGFVDDLDDQNYDAVVERYAIPLLFSSAQGSRVFDTRDLAYTMLVSAFESVRALGAVRTKVSIVSQILADDDTAFALTRLSFHDVDDVEVQALEVNYSLRLINGEWKITVLACNDCPPWLEKFCKPDETPRQSGPEIDAFW